jgi:hypothetical protein
MQVGDSKALVLRAEGDSQLLQPLRTLLKPPQLAAITPTESVST